jgi:3-oxoacyl-[acyl-carrier-protein] synthase-3
MSVHLHDLCWSLGEQRCTLEQTHASGRLFSAPQALHAGGFREHRVAAPETTALTLAERALAEIGDAVGDCDGIVFATALVESAVQCGHERFAKTGDVRWLMDFNGCALQAALGIEAQVFGLTQQACTGLLGAMRLARCLVEAGDCRRVLCITADRFPPGARYEQAFNLISDGAAGGVISSDGAGFRLLGWDHITDGGRRTCSDEATLGSYFAATARCVAAACTRAGIASTELDWLVTQNTHVSASRVLASILRIPLERVVQPSLADAAHVISADVLINLDTLEKSGAVNVGDRIALTMAGYGAHWQSLILEYRP